MPYPGSGTFPGPGVYPGAGTSSTPAVTVAEPYTTADEVRVALAPGSTSWTGTAASMSDDEINDSIADAIAEIDGRLASRYPVPLNPPPPLVENIARDIAAYLATLTYFKGQPIPPGHPVLLRYTRATGLLTAIAAGTIELPLDDGTPGDVESETGPLAAVVNPYDGALFGMSDLSLVPTATIGWDGQRVAGVIGSNGL